ncbi:MAG: starch-binding protein [Oscillospiraceae bacterium]|nr:starch-binding protein [Oscillospiraceae bacterium]
MKKRIFSLLMALVLIGSLVSGMTAVFASGEITIHLHYHRPNGDYEGWQLWAWDHDGQYDITGIDPNGTPTDQPAYGYVPGEDEVIFTIQASTGTNYIGYILRYGEWESKDVEWDQHINITGILSGTIDFYVYSGQPTQSSGDINTVCSVYQLVTEGTMVLRDDVILAEGAMDPPDSTNGSVPPYQTEDTEPTEPQEPEEEPVVPNGPLTEGYTTVHARIPEDWTDPCIFSWATGGYEEVSWPGRSMTQEEGRWYVSQIPYCEDNVIINEAGGSIQTVDTPIGSGHEEVWVVLCDTIDSYGKFNTEVYYEKPSDDVVVEPTPEPDDDPYGMDLFQIPQSLAIVGSGIPGVAEWDPADEAGDMELVGDHLYRKELSLTAGTVMTFKFVGDDVWNDYCNLGSAEIVVGQTTSLVCGGNATDMTLSVDRDCILTFVVDLNDIAQKAGPATVTVMEGAYQETVTIYAQVPAYWENVYCWAWRSSDATAVFEAWPGGEMTLQGQWYQIQVPAWTDNLIINCDTEQTPDIAIELNKDVWIQASDLSNVEVTYHDPALSPDGIPHIEYCYSRQQTSVRVQWKLVAGADGYQLWRTTDPEDDSSWSCVKTITDGAVRTYTNQGLIPGVTYYYKVRAYTQDADGSRTWSDFSDPDFMPAAVIFDGPYSNATYRIRLRWAQVDSAHGYQIWRMEPDGIYRVVKTIGDRGNTLYVDRGDVTAYSNTGLTAGQCYTYKMRAFYITPDGRKIFGTWSDEITVAVQPLPPTLAVSAGSGCAKLRWDAANGAAGYQIWISEDPDQGYTIAKSIPSGDTTSYIKYGLESGKSYYFKIRAYVELDGKKTFGPFSDALPVTIQ